VAALDDDLGTPEALAALHALAGAVHRAEDRETRLALARRLRASANLLGLLQETPERWFRGAPGAEAGPTDEEIEAKLAERAAARKARDFARADALRDALLEAGIELEDTAEGTRWRRAR
ncbi:MAG: DALR domain-containing protein, partial [Pseudomonadales bacterium]|nr:DALR domain-containing protein [Pseudomonadales bacterium]